MNLFDSASLVITPNGYKASKLYSIVPSDGTGDMTFARTGDTATRVNSSGLIETVLANKPRLDYLGGGCPKLLLEPQRTNVFNKSQEFDHTTWLKSYSSITANNAISPDGTSNADSLISNSTTNTHHMGPASTYSFSNTEYVFSVFAKYSGYHIALSIAGTSANWTGCIFDLQNGIAKTPAYQGSQTVCVPKIEDYGNGWYRCSIKFLPYTTGTLFTDISLINSASATLSSYGRLSFLGNGTSGASLYGAQLEAGSYATSYIPTTTASVTRNADSCTKTSASALIGQTEGTFFFDINLDSRLNYSYIMLRNSAVSMYIGVYITDTILRMEVRNSGATQASIAYANTSTGRFKCALGYKENDFVFYVNGNYINADTSGTVPAVDIIDLYYNNTNGIKLNASALWKTRLQNADLAALTTI